MAELQTINSSGELTEIRLGGTADGDKLLTSDEIDAKIPIVTGYVPYTGATTNLDLGDNNITGNVIQAKQTLISGVQSTTDGVMVLHYAGIAQGAIYSLKPPLEDNPSGVSVTFRYPNTRLNGNDGETLATREWVTTDMLDSPPSSASDTGTAGTIKVDSDYIYICVATDTWKRVAISTW